ncbi:AMP-binding protein [Phenylobacterium sp.]|uniref:AMP-binding protein n=1 Tax=Phenylobacterium sp. TaxID=1871053 RepID=UPI0025EDA02D|nr:AMP-binding protein [Phenylobacterium sp.]
MSFEWLSALRGGRRRIQGSPLSQNEERYVLAEAMTTPVYAIPWWHWIVGELDVARLRAAIVDVCNRHEALRTGFGATPEGGFVKYVEDRVAPQLELVQAPDADEVEVRRLLRERFFREPDLSPASLKVFVLIRLAPDRHVFGFSLHHSISDGQSSRIFADEVFARYAGRDLQPVRTFSSVVDPEWPTSEAYAEAREAWERRLASAPTAVGWPADRSDASRLGDDDRVRLEVSPEALAAAEAAAGAIGVSLFFYLYAVVLVGLSRLTGAQDVQTAFQSHGRGGFAGAEGVIGSFSNALVLAESVDERASIAELARRVRDDARGAVASEAFPYHHLIREFGIHPKFGVNWFPNLPGPTASGLEISSGDVSDSQSDYDLNFRFVRTRERLELVVFYKPDSYGEDRVKAAGQLVIDLAEALARDVTAPIGDTSSAALATPGVLPDPREPLQAVRQPPICARFLEQARATPDALAISHQHERWTYAEVEALSREVAHSLRAAGVQAGETVAIVAAREPSLVWTMLGASRAGAIFVVMDAAYPDERLKALNDIVRPKAVMGTDGEAPRAMAAHLAATYGAKFVTADPAAVGADDATWLDQAQADAPAYMLFTSGSTGAPKCVVCSHGPLSHFVAWQAATFGLGPSDRFTLLSGLSHDPLLRDIFTPLSIGASIHVPEQAVILEPGGLRRWFDHARPTVCHTTPAMGRLLVSTPHQHAQLRELRYIFWGGDLLPPELLVDVRGHAPAAENVNFYGSTETPQAAGFHRVEVGVPWRHAPIGRGADGFQLIVVDREHKPRGVGEVGEIAVRSPYLSLGYLGGGQNRDRGVGGPDGPETYYTGDRGVHLPDGSVMALGREDDQVKIRGYRVDLSEVAAALTSHPNVDQAHVTAIDRQGATQMIAFVAGADLEDEPEAALLAHIGQRLPDYMLPQAVRRLPALPLLPNGKIDRQALRGLAEAPTAEATAPADPPATPREAELVAKWQELLPWARVSADSSFFKLGGDSLSYVQVYLATEKVLGAAPEGWQYMPIRALAAESGATPTWLAQVDTPMLIRAVSIFLVVAGHFSLVNYGGGATAALFAVSGFLFGGLQLAEAVETRSARPVWRVLASVLLPTVLYTSSLFLAKLVTGQHPDPSSPLLYGNFRDYSQLSPPDWGGNEFYLWFVDCILQIFLIAGLAIAALSRVSFLGLDRFGVALVLFLAGCVGRFVLPGFMYPDFYSQGAAPLAMVHYLPTTHLATFALGAMAASASGRLRPWIVVALTLPYAMAASHFFYLNAGLAIGGGVLVMLLVHRVPLPRPVARLVYTLSGASLFIYLTHFQISVILHWLAIADSPLLQVVFALAGGTLAWMTWNRLVAIFGRRNRRHEAAPTAL